MRTAISSFDFVAHKVRQKQSYIFQKSAGNKNDTSEAITSGGGYRELDISPHFRAPI